MQWGLELVAAVAGALSAFTCLVWFSKSRNMGHLLMGIAMLVVAGVFGYLALN